ncbi:hypothetical protein PSQ19_00240 [Devosia algicola]|uniref:Uncharacterized protein n=1 Tax=Devosia algicola TaxID=3026418 RepID=A0ABY7YN22_9HYPH|nr:hypothetical protein [Devosia algicola]WDR02711.1 hypothetical protein PSQ19_00240 [Devosia algicola]
MTLPNGISFLITASARDDGALMLHIPADEKAPRRACAFSIVPGAANTIFISANKLVAK